MSRLLIISSLFQFIPLLLIGQRTAVVDIAEHEVPKAIVTQFRSQHQLVREAIWYPYPNQYRKEKSSRFLYYPINGTAYAYHYFEVRFADERGQWRKVYDRSGTWTITSRMLTTADVPTKIFVQLSSRGYEIRDQLRIEHIARTGEQGTFYKIWLQNGNKQRILYFNESGTLVKSLKFDDDTNFTEDQQTRFKSAPRAFQKDNKAHARIQQKVINQIRSKFGEFNNSEWYEFDYTSYSFRMKNRELSYYDLDIPGYYAVRFNAQNICYIALFNPEGIILEMAEVINSESLPQDIQRNIKNDFSSRKLGQEHHKVSLQDGSELYKIYFEFEGQLELIIMNKHGATMEFQ